MPPKMNEVSWKFSFTTQVVNNDWMAALYAVAPPTYKEPVPETYTATLATDEDEDT
jgi:hypothetical protein